MNDSVQRKVETTYAELLQSRLASVSRRLCSLADACDRANGEVARVVDSGRTNYGDVVGTVQHTILWGVANLSLDGLVSLARDADEAALIARQHGEAGYSLDLAEWDVEKDGDGREATPERKG